MKKNVRSPFDQDVAKQLRRDPEYASAYLEELAKVPLSSQLAILRRLRGFTQEKVASNLHVKQAHISKLEKPKTDHLLSNYEKAARMLHGRLMIVPDEIKLVSVA